VDGVPGPAVGLIRPRRDHHLRRQRLRAPDQRDRRRLLRSGGIVHLSHDIEDLFQFYTTPNQTPAIPNGEDAPERLMYMFRANQTGTPDGLPAPFNSTDPFTNGGCPAFVTNRFVSPNDATLDAQDSGGLFNPSSPPATQQTQTFTGLAGSGTSRRSSVRPGRPMARRCIFGWTALVCPVWTFRRSLRFLVAPRCRGQHAAEARVRGVRSDRGGLSTDAGQRCCSGPAGPVQRRPR